jgi:hypothetical protein
MVAGWSYRDVAGKHRTGVQVTSTCSGSATTRSAKSGNWRRPCAAGKNCGSISGGWLSPMREAHEPYRHRANHYQSRVTPKYRVRSESFTSLSSRASVLLSSRFSLTPWVSRPTALPTRLIPSSGMPMDLSVLLV